MHMKKASNATFEATQVTKPIIKRKKHATCCIYLLLFSRTWSEQPSMRHSKTGLLMQVAAHRRYFCIQNVILGNGQVASHTRLAAHKSGCSLQMNFALHLNKCNLEGFGSCDDFPEKQISSCPSFLHVCQTCHNTVRKPQFWMIFVCFFATRVSIMGLFSYKINQVWP